MLYSRRMPAGLTVAAQDANRLGQVAAERLFARLDGERGAARRVVNPTTLIERGSGELRPVILFGSGETRP